MSEHPGRAVARRLGRLGAFNNLDRLPAARAQAFVTAIEDLGYGAFWYPETVGGKETFVHATLLLAGSRRIVIATGIANIWARDPMAMANGAKVLGEAYPGRFLLGLGVSHRPSVATRGHEYGRPLDRMRAYLDAMDAARYAGPEPTEPVPRVLAALGPRMLRLAAERSAGAHPYFVPVEHTTVAREAVGPGPFLAVEQAAILERDAETARRVAREHTARYLRLENYTNNLRRCGFRDTDLADGGSDRLVDAIVAWGDVDALARRVEDHFARGADHVCVQFLRADGQPPVDELHALASALAP